MLPADALWNFCVALASFLVLASSTPNAIGLQFHTVLYWQPTPPAPSDCLMPWQAEKRANAYQAALDKANKASEALRASAAQDAGGNIGDDEADNELQASLARARRMATRKKPAGSGLEQIAEAISKVKA